MQVQPVVAPASPAAPGAGRAVPAAPVAPESGSAAGEVEMRRGEPFPADAVRTPAGDVAREYASNLLAIPNAMSVSWRNSDDSPLTLRMLDQESADLAHALLEQSIGGVELKVSIFGSKEPYTPGPAQPRTSNLVRAIAGMHGVWAYTYAQTPPWVDGHVTMRTIDTETRDSLDAILRDKLPFGTKPDGSARSMFVHWRAGVPAPR